MPGPFFILRMIRLALGQIWANKLRSMLTTIGIVIGVASVTAVVAALTGLRSTVLDEVQMFGANKLFVFPSRPDGVPANRFPWERIRISRAEAEAIAGHCPSIRRVTPILPFGASIEFQGRSRAGVEVRGIWPDWHEVERRRVLMGRPFVPADEDDAKPVCLVNEEAIRELDLPRDPTGSAILIANRRFIIVGVVETLQATVINRGETASEVFVPLATAARLQGIRPFMYLIAQTHSPELAEDAKAEVRYVMRNLRRLGPEDPDTFRISAIDQFIEQFRSISAGITAIAGGIVAISLLVGGIGIMNIMLVSVSERTREIGLRKAVGATPLAILLQFLTEAITLSVLGGLAGLGLGALLTWLMTIPEKGLPSASIPTWAVIMALAFSGGVGVLFGIFPALKAARLDPIVALRHE
ncbi:MAG: ABC transporter permease [Phycisphaeraceae bacterium]|nr:ABC transporter permease [Phycisphaeraceae bacterium]